MHPYGHYPGQPYYPPAYPGYDPQAFPPPAAVPPPSDGGIGSGEHGLRTSGGSHYPQQPSGPGQYPGWAPPYGHQPYYSPYGAPGSGNAPYPQYPSPAPVPQGLQSFEVLKYILQGMMPDVERMIAQENIDAAAVKMEEMKNYKMRNMHLIVSDEALAYLRSLDQWMDKQGVAIESVRMNRMSLNNSSGSQPLSGGSPSLPSSSSPYINTSPSSSAQYVSTGSPSMSQSSSSQPLSSSIRTSDSVPLRASREISGNIQYVGTDATADPVQYVDPSAPTSSIEYSSSNDRSPYVYVDKQTKPLTYVDYDKSSIDDDIKRAKEENTKQLIKEMQSKYNYREIEYEELRFVEKIGSGAFGAVYRGTWRGAVVAIKKLHDFDWFNMETVEEFRREAALAQLLSNHPNVVNFVGACSRAPNFCMVSEFCEFGSLESVLRGKHAVGLSFKDKARIARDAAAGIYHLHCEGVIHRDIAARNVMIGPEYTVFVGDFGFARLKEKGAAYAKTKSSLGPVKYMSPESIKEKKYSEKSDAFSFGVLLWELLTGKEPYEDEPLLQIALRVASQGLRLEVPTGTPEPLAKLMRDCWEQKPEDRPSFPAIIQRLYEFHDSL